MKRISVLIVFLVYGFSPTIWADKTSFITTGTLRARALAMGSAYNSIEDDFSAGLYNPGALRPEIPQQERQWRLLFNPVTPLIALHDYATYDRSFSRDDSFTLGEGLISTMYTLKGAVYSTSVVDIGASFSEEVVTSDSTAIHSDRMFSIERLTKCSFNSLFCNFKIASQVSLGMSGTLYHTRTHGESKYESGYSFGVLFVPNPKMNVGLVYFKTPQKLSQARVTLENIETDTVSGGISYYPDKDTVISLDLRNLNQEDKSTSREVHTGLERRIGRIALRAGYFRKKSTQDDVISAGIGILPLWTKVNKNSNATRHDILSYTYIREEGSGQKHWHIVSLLLQY